MQSIKKRVARAIKDRVVRPIRQSKIVGAIKSRFVRKYREKHREIYENNKKNTKRNIIINAILEKIEYFFQNIDEKLKNLQTNVNYKSGALKELLFLNRFNHTVRDSIGYNTILRKNNLTHFLNYVLASVLGINDNSKDESFFDRISDLLSILFDDKRTEENKKKFKSYIYSALKRLSRTKSNILDILYMIDEIMLYRFNYLPSLQITKYSAKPEIYKMPAASSKDVQDRHNKLIQIVIDKTGFLLDAKLIDTDVNGIKAEGINFYNSSDNNNKTIQTRLQAQPTLISLPTTQPPVPSESSVAAESHDAPAASPGPTTESSVAAESPVASASHAPAASPGPTTASSVAAASHDAPAASPGPAPGTPYAAPPVPPVILPSTRTDSLLKLNSHINNKPVKKLSKFKRLKKYLGFENKSTRKNLGVENKSTRKNKSVPNFPFKFVANYNAVLFELEVYDSENGIWLLEYDFRKSQRKEPAYLNYTYDDGVLTINEPMYIKTPNTNIIRKPNGKIFAMRVMRRNKSKKGKNNPLDADQDKFKGPMYVYEYQTFNSSAKFTLTLDNQESNIIETPEETRNGEGVPKRTFILPNAVKLPNGMIRARYVLNKIGNYLPTNVFNFSVENGIYKILSVKRFDVKCNKSKLVNNCGQNDPSQYAYDIQQSYDYKINSKKLLALTPNYDELFNNNAQYTYRKRTYDPYVSTVLPQSNPPSEGTKVPNNVSNTNPKNINKSTKKTPPVYAKVVKEATATSSPPSRNNPPFDDSPLPVNRGKALAEKLRRLRINPVTPVASVQSQELANPSGPPINKPYWNPFVTPPTEYISVRGTPTSVENPNGGSYRKKHSKMTKKKSSKK